MKQKVVIGLPVFNEIESLEKVIDGIRQLGLPFFIVDNHSTDGTTQLAEKLEIEVFQRDEYGPGYGAGIRKAFDIAFDKQFEYLAILDCDTTYDPNDLLFLLSKMETNTDLIVGARPMNKIVLSHRIVNYLHTYFARALFLSSTLDINSGIRIMRISKFRGKVNARNMGMVAQISSLALRKKMNIKECQVSYGDRLGKSKIKIIDTFFIFWNILLERFKK